MTRPPIPAFGSRDACCWRFHGFLYLAFCQVTLCCGDVRYRETDPRPSIQHKDTLKNDLHVASLPLLKRRTRPDWSKPTPARIASMAVPSRRVTGSPAENTPIISATTGGI